MNSRRGRNRDSGLRWNSGISRNPPKAPSYEEQERRDEERRRELGCPICHAPNHGSDYHDHPVSCVCDAHIGLGLTAEEV